MSTSKGDGMSDELYKLRVSRDYRRTFDTVAHSPDLGKLRAIGDSYDGMELPWVIENGDGEIVERCAIDKRIIAQNAAETELRGRQRDFIPAATDALSLLVEGHVEAATEKGLDALNILAHGKQEAS